MVEFLGYIVSSDGISLDGKKTQTIVDWIASSSVRDVQCLLGFPNFYKIFIKDYSKITAPLTRLIGKDKFVWNKKAKEVFEILKKALLLAPILIHADSSKSFFLEADASDIAFGSILSQYGKDGQLHPIAYHSLKFSD
jgi:hypothetical protein